VHHVGEFTAEVTVEMGKVNVLGTGWAIVGGRRMTGLGVDVGNPHLACLDADLSAEDLASLDVGSSVEFDPQQFPEGVNIEILTAPRAQDSEHGALGSGIPANVSVSMRVHERGVGETRSCGTGTVAAACAALAHLGETTGALQVRIPGGEVYVGITDSTSYLRGPSVLLARGELADAWWASQG
jgi:diaminopimelate epimerase